MVKENKTAMTLSKTSARPAIAVYGVNSACLFCNAVQRRIASYCGKTKGSVVSQTVINALRDSRWNSQALDRQHKNLQWPPPSPG